MSDSERRLTMAAGSRVVLTAGLLAAALCHGCAKTGADMSRSPVSKSPVLCSLSNGQFELAVAPATGRIVRYGRLGGRNLLWDNPRAPEALSPFPGWLNWGGDKVWIWPESDWKLWQNREEGSPPGDPAPAAYQVVKMSPRQLRMTSPVIAGYGIRIVREITLEETGSRVRLVNTLEKVAAGTLSLPVAPWVVTQIPAPPAVLARLAANAPAPGYAPYPPNPWNAAAVAGRVVVMKRPPAPWVKMGLEADVLAVAMDGLLFTAAIESPAYAAEKYQPLCRTQVFSNPDKSDYRPPGTAPYVELEFTAPVKMLAPGESVSLIMVWELHPVREDEAVEFLQRWQNGQAPDRR